MVSSSTIVSPPVSSNTTSSAARTAAKRARAAKHQRARLLALAAVLDDLAERACPACAKAADIAATETKELQQLEEDETPCTCDDESGSIGTTGIRLPSTDSFLARAVGGQGRGRGAVSSGAAVCALVYVGRVHACDGLRRGNAGALLLGALALAAAYVDRRNAIVALARAAGVPVAAVASLRDSLITALKHRTYISPATFREFDAILDDLAR